MKFLLVLTTALCLLSSTYALASNSIAPAQVVCAEGRSLKEVTANINTLIRSAQVSGYESVSSPTLSSYAGGKPYEMCVVFSCFSQSCKANGGRR